MDQRKIDNIARGSAFAITGLFDNIKKSLGVTDEELANIRPTVVVGMSRSEQCEDDTTLALIYSMAVLKGKLVKLSLSTDGVYFEVIPQTSG